MEIKKLANNALDFGVNRIIEIFGIIIVIFGFLLLISLISFSPDDPNFIFPENTQIKNFLGFRGSFTSDLFFQSFGLIALLIPFSLILTGVNIFLNTGWSELPGASFKRVRAQSSHAARAPSRLQTARLRAPVRHDD